jgi:hypothetical protein
MDVVDHAELGDGSVDLRVVDSVEGGADQGQKRVLVRHPDRLPA